MSHSILATPVGWFVLSTIGGLVLDASLCDSYGEALAAWVALEGAL
jgi:hypothetical protein